MFEGNFNESLEVKSLRKTWHALTYWHVMTQSAGFDYPGCDDPNDYLPGENWTYSDYNPYFLKWNPPVF